MRSKAVMVVAACAFLPSCASAIVRPAAVPSRHADALLVLPGFGYSRAGERALRSLEPALAAEGLDLFVPACLSRGGLEDSRVRLERFIRQHRLERYERVHVFAFIAGAWTFNPLLDEGALPNVATIVYDRSPYQERAPRIARDRIPILTWLRYGPVVFDLARTPYPRVQAPRAHVALVVETVPTSFVRRFGADARRQGPYRFECGAFEQRYDDCLFVAMNHEELYRDFALVWPEIRSFIRRGRFTAAANRTQPIVGGRQ